MRNDIVMIQETKLKEKPEYDEDQYTVFFTPSKEGGNAKRGLLCIVRKGVDACEVQIPKAVQKTEVQAVSLHIDNR